MMGTLPGAVGNLLAFGLVRAHTKDLVGYVSDGGQSLSAGSGRHLD